MMQTVRKKTQETRDRLLDAAEDVFNLKGVSGTTLNDIARAAGVTRGAIYWHFKNKSDLFEAMIERVMNPVRQMIEEIADEKTENPLGSLSEKTACMINRILENPHYLKVMGILYHKCEMTEDTGEVWQHQKEWTTRGHNTVTRVLENACKKGQLPKDLDIGLASLVLHVVFHGLLNRWLFMPDSFDLVENSRRINAGILFMLQHSPDLKTAS